MQLIYSLLLFVLMHRCVHDMEQSCTADCVAEWFACWFLGLQIAVSNLSGATF